MEYVARKSNLVVPEGFVELDREEMTYVDGGFYISYDDMKSFILATGRYGANVGATAAAIISQLGGIKAALSLAYHSITAWINTVPLVGQVLYGYLALNAVYLIGKMATAYLQQQGVEIGFRWFHFTAKIC